MTSLLTNAVLAGRRSKNGLYAMFHYTRHALWTVVHENSWKSCNRDCCFSCIEYRNHLLKKYPFHSLKSTNSCIAYYAGEPMIASFSKSSHGLNGGPIPVHNRSMCHFMLKRSARKIVWVTDNDTIWIMHLCECRRDERNKRELKEQGMWENETSRQGKLK